MGAATELSLTRQDGLSEAAAIAAQGLRRSALAPVWLACAALSIDVPVLAAALWFAQYAAIPAQSFDAVAAAGMALLGAACTATILAATSSYRPQIMRRFGVSVGRAACAGVLPVAGLMLAAPASDPLPMLAATVAALAGAMVPTRIGGAVVARWMLDTRLLDRRAVIAGGGEAAEHLIRGLAQRPGNDIRLHGIFDDRDDLRSPIQVLGIPKIGSYEELLAFVRVAEIDMVIISLPLHAEERIQWLLDAFKVLPVEVRLSSFSRGYAFTATDRDPLISALRRSFAPERRLTKRAFDLVFASVVLIPALPIMALAALAIRIDSAGPILFRQKRHGYNDRVIDVLKFRSMYADQSDPRARQVVTRDDPRVTRVGRFLRRSSIDELPQLFNVLCGHLSLVGPRPHAVDAVSSRHERFSRIVDGYSARHRLPPGITGWAQVNGWRGEIDDRDALHARVEHDLYYIENWSIWMDLRILLRTPASLLNTTRAY